MADLARVTGGAAVSPPSISGSDINWSTGPAPPVLTEPSVAIVLYPGGPAIHQGSEQDDSLTGGVAGEGIHGLYGDDTLLGGGGNDTLIGGGDAGDTLVLRSVTLDDFITGLKLQSNLLDWILPGDEPPQLHARIEADGIRFYADQTYMAGTGGAHTMATGTLTIGGETIDFRSIAVFRLEP
ncbi:hypothetical protein ACLF3G_16920 [Falsiroseomonas sp. HC035]|uniref:hypothetical protein n=1 Tax=Falsiroseomonas sp. HC035 TaxID=3390999 RepID=UPI003D31F277